MNERRHGEPGRRDDDWRFENIERLLEHVQDQLEPDKLDRRYITRREIEANARSGDVVLKVIMAITAVGVLVNSILLTAFHH